MDAIIWFVATLVLLVIVVQWLHRHILGFFFLLSGNEDVALILYFFPLSPGVLLHELSHTVAAFILRVRAGGFTVFPRRDPTGRITLGSVMVEQVDPIRASLIGVAPLVFGCGAVLLIGYHVFGLSDMESVLLAGDFQAIVATAGRILQTPDAWLWLYLMFAISTTMLPSASDRETWPPVILFIAGVVALVVLSNQTAILEAFAGSLGVAINWLTAAFVITLAINLPVAALLVLLEWGTASIIGRRVYYSRPGDDKPKKRR